VIRAEERDRLAKGLHADGIATGIHYPIPIHLQEAYADLGHKKGSFPVTEGLAGHVLSLPMYAELPSNSMDYVAEAIKEILNGDVRIP
jgi:dTDP-4-amino-4,6-dideoxygalactose transaminase